ncbi:unnamed protein product [Sphenostylis stenocarpa]|uniref:Uncharacterized protein n=1 Tax=Sphenostylis stenocarpa TaxID=92480 RepID=A0AA86VPW6_9FABA|nr:unnamed protein product [Sphenostylis stenocarpa]
MGGLFAKLAKAIAGFVINVLCSFSFHRQRRSHVPTGDPYFPSLSVTEPKEWCVGMEFPSEWVLSEANKLCE